MGVRFLPFCLCLAAPAAFPQSLKTIQVLNDRAPDCSSLESIVATVTRGCETDDAKAIAIYNFCRYAYYHHRYPSEKGGISALKLINVYGWSLCGGQHTVMAALWEKAGFKHRYRGWRRPGHTTVEAFYGGRWHYLDTFLKFYCWTPAPNFPGGRTVASQEDIRANPALVAEGFVLDPERKVAYHKNNRFTYTAEGVSWTAPAFMVCGDTLDGVLSGVRSSRDSGSPRGWAGIKFDDPAYATSVDLAPGYALTLRWSKVEDGWYFRGQKRGPHHTCGDKDYRNCPAIGPILEPYNALGRARTWSNGTLLFRPDLRSEACLAGLRQVANVAWREGALRPDDPARPASFVVPMASPYVVARARARIACDGARIEVSTDEGKSWTAVRPPDLADAVRGAYRYLVRITFESPLTALELSSLLQHNQEALPYLAPGKNAITVTAANPQALDGSRLVVTYAYCLGHRSRTPEEIYERGAELFRAHYAQWAEKPLVVQRVIRKLPATLQIPVPTPKGKQPVYPRMVFLRREVLAPGQEPLAVPAPPSEPAVGPDETLATLPHPWTIGTQPPKPQPDRPTRTTVLAPTRVGYCNMKGEVFPYQFVKWLKDNSNAWVLLLDFEASRLPDPRRLARATLVLYVHEAHDKAPMQVAAVMLDAPFEPDKPYDFSKLGRRLGTTIVERGRGPGAPFEPPRRYEIDVTRAVRAWARGEPAHGLAVRIVPNRSVDDGWTVRFTPAREKPAELAIATYADE
ncbi:MAG: hypothetical protein ACLF0G_02660 [Candidatus Brocadiia bacterium]